MLRRCLTCTCSSHFPRRVLLSSFASSSTSSPSSSGFVTDRIRSDGLNWLKTEETQRKLFVKENERTRAYLRDTEDLRQRLYKELACYQNQANSDSSLHDVVAEEDEEEDGDYIYYSTRAEEKGVHRLCRRHKTSQKEQVLIDLQALAEEHGWASLHGLKISQDQSKVAFLVELGQSREEYTCIARDLSVPGAPEHVISKRAVSIEWGKDHRYLYHTKPDELGRPYQVCRTDLQPLWEGGLGSKDTKKENAVEDSAKEEIVYSETDPNYYLDLSVTKDWEYLTITSVSRTSSEVRVIAMGEKAIETEKQCSSPEMILLRGREEGIEYYVEHNRGMFFMLSNCYNPKSGYKLFVTSAQGAHRLQEKWQELRWDEEGAKIDGMGEELVDMEMFKNFVVLYGRTSRGQASIKVMHLEGLPNVVKVEEVPLDRSTPIALHHGVNKEFDSEVLSFSVSTPVHNLANFRYNMTSATLEGAGNHHTENRLFDCKLLEIQSRDGTNIPVTLVFSKAHPPSRSSPLLMQVYAAYGMNLEPQYDVSHFPLLKRGWCQVLVHARGGGECGKSWHRQAKMKNKEKSMEDFQDVYHYFVANHYCDPDLVAAKVHSAGGLVLGATINQHPTMFKSVITNAPFVDLLSVMTDSSLPHTVSEYEEWGNPAVEEELEYMAKYCPYFNVRSNTALYPAILATSSTNDVRVPFWVVCKWIHRIRNNQAQVGQARPVLLRGDLDANHFGKTGPDGAVVEASIENAFLIKTVTS